MMNAIEQARFNPPYEQMLLALTEVTRRHATARLEALLRPFKRRREDAI